MIIRPANYLPATIRFISDTTKMVEAATLAAQNATRGFGRRLEYQASPEMLNAHTVTLIKMRENPIKGFLAGLGINRWIYASGAPRLVTDADICQVEKLCTSPNILPFSVKDSLALCKNLYLEFSPNVNHLGAPPFIDPDTANLPLFAKIAFTSTYFNLTSVNSLVDLAQKREMSIKFLGTEEAEHTCITILNEHAPERPPSPFEYFFLKVDTDMAGNWAQLAQLDQRQPPAIKENLKERAEHLATQMNELPHSSLLYVDSSLLPALTREIEKRGMPKLEFLPV